MFRSSFTHWDSMSGKVWSYSPLYGTCDIGKYDLIWFDLIWEIRHSKSHWKQHSLWRKFIFLHCRFTSNKYFFISFPFFLICRCNCSWKLYSKVGTNIYVDIKAYPHSLTQRRGIILFQWCCIFYCICF